ncbi:acetate--CoA ligase family protein [Rhodoplanes roseus]|nr:acetate--CoA ligase family protein [Rhodoplanes roseus]
MRPRSVAVVGASERDDAIGTRVITNLRALGFPGTIHPVNPRYQTIKGLTSYPSLSALPETVDAAFLAVPATGGPDLVEEAGRCGIKAVFLNANGYADGDQDGKALQRRIEASAKAHGIAICGPNNIGLINVHDRIALWTPRHMKQVTPGPIGVISQSGSIALILSEDERDLGFAYLVTTGNEAVLTVADYLAAMVTDDRVKVVLLFLETIRDPAKFREAAAEAARRGKPIVALKLGTSEGGRTLVQAHTGGLAGEDRLYDAFFAQYGIVRVRDLDEMLETAVMLAADPAPIRTGHTVVVTLSGGEAALAADLGADLGLEFDRLSPATIEKLRPAFPPYSSINNPVDAWGLGFTAERFGIVLDALVADDEIGVLGFAVDAPGRGGGDVAYAKVMAEACRRVAAQKKRMFFLNNTSGSGVNAEVRAILDEARIPYLSGLRPGLAAVRNARLLGKATAIGEAVPTPPNIPDDEPGRFAVLTEFGVPMAQSRAVGSDDEAVAAATSLGFPVVMKGTAAHLPHKTELGLVRLGLADEAAVRTAYAELSARLAEHSRENSPGEVVVQETAPGGVELILGLRNEGAFGSFVVVAPGGILVDLGGRASIRMAPVDAETARAMLDETAAGTLLGGVRGRPPSDIQAAVDAIVAFSQLGAACRERFAAIEINPLIVGREGAMGVDVLFDTIPDRGTE